MNDRVSRRPPNTYIGDEDIRERYEREENGEITEQEDGTPLRRSCIIQMCQWLDHLRTGQMPLAIQVSSALAERLPLLSILAIGESRQGQNSRRKRLPSKEP